MRGIDDDFVMAFLEAQGPLLQYIQSIVPRLKDAEDVLQETAITLWEKRSDYAPERGSFIAWGRGIARLKALEFMRKNRPQAIFSEAISIKLDELAIAASQDDSQRERQIDALQCCIERLSKNEQATLDKHYRQKKSISEIAAEHGKGLSTIYERLQKIRSRLSRCIQRNLEPGVHPL